MAALTPDIGKARRLVVKIGSALLVDRASGTLRADWLRGLARDVATLKARGTDVVLVSSGSIALGRGALGLGDGALPLERAQAAASVGQIRLARAYEEALQPHGLTAAQILLTLEDSADRRRYLNARATMGMLLSLGAVPIVNENDTIATDEIRFGDNDRLAAQIAVTIGADQLVLLSDVDGLYTANPQIDADARHIPLVETITPEIAAMAGESASFLSKGGMRTKLLAARTATGAGCAMAIAPGEACDALGRLERGGRSTWFLAQTDPQAARKAWIAAMKPQGTLTIDAGAARALAAGGSLLPAGIARVEGAFGRGDSVAITGVDGSVVGFGLARYTADEARVIAGRHSGEIPALLGYPGRAAVVHRDDMVV